MEGDDLSDDDEEAGIKRQDIDTIVISDDEEEHSFHLPIRIGRKEHKDRPMEINTEASSEKAREILEKAEESGSAPTGEVLENMSNKNKSKSKTTNKKRQDPTAEKPWRGVWSDEDDSDSLGNAGDAPGIVTRKRQPRSKRSLATAKPGERVVFLQTEEDRAEYNRYNENLHHLRYELGPAESTTDDNGDAKMKDDEANGEKPTVRDNNSYLFQLPPVMPEVCEQEVKKEASAVAKKEEQKEVKVEETFSNLSEIAKRPDIPSGCVGKLRVYKSGATVMDWGGTSYMLKPGTRASFLQEAVSLQVFPEKDRVVPEVSGETMSMGRIKGKFVVMPDLDKMLGIKTVHKTTG